MIMLPILMLPLTHFSKIWRMNLAVKGLNFTDYLLFEFVRSSSSGEHEGEKEAVIAEYIRSLELEGR